MRSWVVSRISGLNMIRLRLKIHGRRLVCLGVKVSSYLHCRVLLGRRCADLRERVFGSKFLVLVMRGIRVAVRVLVSLVAPAFGVCELRIVSFKRFERVIVFRHVKRRLSS